MKRTLRFIATVLVVAALAALGFWLDYEYTAWKVERITGGPR